MALFTNAELEPKERVNLLLLNADEQKVQSPEFPSWFEPCYIWPLRKPKDCAKSSNMFRPEASPASKQENVGFHTARHESTIGSSL